MAIEEGGEYASAMDDQYSDVLATRTVPAGEFKTHCLRLMDEVSETGEEIVVTKHSKPVVRITPYQEERPKLFGSCKGELRIFVDLDSVQAIPLDDWDMIARPERILHPERYP